MCFSAEASFGGAAVLSAIGYATLRKTDSNPSLRWIAGIPFLFAIQQASEGILWLSFTYAIPSEIVTLAKYAYLIFAFIIWPFWIPFAFAYAEPQGWRQNLLRGLLAIGSLTALVFAYSGFSQMVSFVVWGQTLRYLGSAPDLTIPYALATLIPFFVTSLNKFKWVGIGMVAAFLGSLYIYYYTFTSVWCFSAALLSAGFYLALREEPERNSITSSKA